MSGGEQQRVAIAVALANRPEVLLADEPTGELDTANARQIFDLFRHLNTSLGVTIVVATHDALVSEQVNRTVAIRDGRVSSEVLRHRSISAEGDHQVVATEYAVLDRAGRLQLPRAHVEALGLAPARSARARGRPHQRLAGRPSGRGADEAGERPGGEAHPRPRRSDEPMSEYLATSAGRPGTTRDRRPDGRGASACARDFPMGSTVVHALDGVDLRIARGELVAVRGRSGSGKTTLLSLIGGLDLPTAGHVLVDGQSVSEMTPAELVELRRRKVGFIFQAFGLLSILSAAENVEVPMRLVAADPRERDDRVAVLLELVGLGDRARHRPHELSGGEQQRVAIARALANRPQLLLADEPTGQLDSGTGQAVMGLLRGIVRSEGLTAVIATHDPSLLDIADRVVELRDGRVVDGAGTTG